MSIEAQGINLEVFNAIGGINIILFLKFCSVDAIFSSGLGRLVNDALPNKANCNCVMRKMKVGSRIHLALYALRDIMIGEELRYDYGVKDLPWRSLCAEGIVKVFMVALL